MRTIGDHRQLNDAAFHAGVNSDSEYDWLDPYNNLHYYVIDKHTDENGVLSYTVAVQNPTGAGPHIRGAGEASAPALDLVGTWAYCQFPLTNTGTTVATSASLHPENVNAYLSSDVYRLSASAAGDGWNAQLANALAAVRTGQTKTIPVYVTRTNGSAASAVVSLTATSVSNAAATSTADCAVSVPPPTIEYTLDPADPSGANGWYAGNVDLAWQVSDADAIVGGCVDESFLIDGVYDRTCSAVSDGGTTTVDVTVKRDATPPEVAVTGVADGAVYVLGTEPMPGCSTSDGLSGVDEAASLVVVGGPIVGYFAAACVGGRDIAGNVSSASASYQIVYDRSGFLGPIADPPTVNTVTAGSARPVKFSLAGDQGLGVLAGGSPTIQLTNCSTGDASGTPISTVAAEPFYYDPILDEYVYAWKTQKAWNGSCGRLDVTLIDGTTRSAFFNFVK
jgi:hypothetical protein